MKRLIPGVPFCDCDHYPCGHVALDSMLQFYGYATPLVLHDQWFFLYRRKDDGGIQIDSRLTPVPQSMLRWGIRLLDHQETEGEAAWARVKARVDSGHPAPVLADTYYLETYYYPGLGHHSDHSVILAGYDDEAGTVHVVDASPSKLFRGDLPLSGLLEAWGSGHIPRYRWLEFRLPESPRALTPEQAAQAIQQNVRLMFQEAAPLPGAFVGLRGLRALAEDIALWMDLAPDQARAQAGRLFDLLRPVVMEREGHSRYLGLVAGQFGGSNLPQVSEQVRVISQKWLVFRNLCLKGQKKDTGLTLRKMHGRLLEVLSLEEEALTRLGDVSAAC